MRKQLSSSPSYCWKKMYGWTLIPEKSFISRENKRKKICYQFPSKVLLGQETKEGKGKGKEKKKGKMGKKGGKHYLSIYIFKKKNLAQMYLWHKVGTNDRAMLSVAKYLLVKDKGFESSSLPPPRSFKARGIPLSLHSIRVWSQSLSRAGSQLFSVPGRSWALQSQFLPPRRSS